MTETVRKRSVPYGDGRYRRGGTAVPTPACQGTSETCRRRRKPKMLLPSWQTVAAVTPKPRGAAISRPQSTERSRNFGSSPSFPPFPDAPPEPPAHDNAETAPPTDTAHRPWPRRAAAHILQGETLHRKKGGSRRATAVSRHRRRHPARHLPPGGLCRPALPAPDPTRRYPRHHRRPRRSRPLADENKKRERAPGSAKTGGDLFSERSPPASVQKTCKVPDGRCGARPLPPTAMFTGVGAVPPSSPRIPPR